jgi:hypothetical protein
MSQTGLMRNDEFTKHAVRVRHGNEARRLLCGLALTHFSPRGALPDAARDHLILMAASATIQVCPVADATPPLPPWLDYEVNSGPQPQGCQSPGCIPKPRKPQARSRRDRVRFASGFDFS